MSYDQQLANAMSEIAALRAALQDCGTSEDNPDTCGVCGLHFAECEADQRIKPTAGVENPTVISQPACAGARARALLSRRTA